MVDALAALQQQQVLMVNGNTLQGSLDGRGHSATDSSGWHGRLPARGAAVAIDCTAAEALPVDHVVVETIYASSPVSVSTS